MLRSQLIIVGVATLLATSPALAQSKENLPVIVTTGEAEVKRPPDRAWVTINAESRSKDPREAQRQNVSAMDAVMAKLKGMNLGDDAIRTIAYELHPEYDYVEGRQILRGYVARNSIEVRIDDISRVGDVLGVSVGSGATSVGGLRFGLKDGAASQSTATANDRLVGEFFAIKSGMIQEVHAVLFNLPDSEPTGWPAEYGPPRGGWPVP